MNISLLSFNFRNGLLLTVAVILFATVIGSAHAQQTQDLINRLQRMQNELTTLQRHVYRGKKPGSAGVAASSPAITSNTAMARLSNRIAQLEAEIRRLTGTNEELNHRISQLQGRLDKMSTDLEFRLKTLEGGKPASANDTPPPGTNVAPPAPAPEPRDSTPVAGAEKGVKPFGTTATLPPKASGQTAAVPLAKTETPEQQYDRAHSLIVKQRDFVAAERVLTAFIDKNRKHRLAPNAHYWLGRTYFVRSDFQQAAIAFAEGFQRYPKSKKAPATLLNLGMSLARLGKNREACTTYTRLKRNFRSIEESVKRRLARERKRSKCRR
ncbi:MAG: tol-pal system protein YbgF [Rhodospirillaceae bacterium]|nr:tol-pal system protein YbgF [Rhodospirillaceae bacterium]|tara:strand:- start:13027 stop:14001 length:975 start_codon:yes stop_codon:yes gene_type:complete